MEQAASVGSGVARGGPAGGGGARGFLRQFLSNPTQIGAVAPSGRRLAERMVEGLDLAGAGVVLEYGPGTGAFTDLATTRTGPRTKYIAIELNDHMATVLQARHPGLPVHRRSVTEASEVCAAEGLAREGAVDIILSGLPWASFPDELQVAALEATRRVLKPGGRFVTFGYHIGTLLKQGKRFYGRVGGYFAHVERSGMVWRNLPPAFVLRCTK